MYMLCSVIRREVWVGGVLHQVLVQLGLNLSQHIYSCSLAHMLDAQYMCRICVDVLGSTCKCTNWLMCSSKFEYVQQTKIQQKDMCNKHT